MNLKFVKATNEDAEELIHIQDACFYLDYLKYGECPLYHQSKRAIEEDIEAHIVFKVMVNGKCVGDIIARKIKEDRYFLHCLCILPDFENQGIGQKAINFIERFCEDAVSWELMTPSDKVKNHYFFHKCKYNRKGEEQKGNTKLSHFGKEGIV